MLQCPIAAADPPAAPRALIVEDERIVALGLQTQLESLGYAIAGTAASGEAAVALAERLRPDLVLMDICLEGPMDGIETAALLRQRLDVPVVFLTAYSDQEIIERAKITGPLGYVLKPYEERELHIVLEMALYRHRMERTLREREQFLRATLRGIGEGLITTDLDGRITYLNAAAERLYGCTTAEVLGQAVNQFCPADRAHEIDTALEQVRRGQAVAPYETIRHRKDGQQLHVIVTVSPILDDREVVVGATAILRDVTQLRLLEGQYRQAQKMEAVGRLAGGVAHDFNNLLTVMNGFASMVLADPAIEGPNREMLEQVVQASDRAAVLTRQLLAYGRKQVFRLEVTNLNDLVCRTSAMLGRIIGEDVDLCVSLAPEPVWARVDAGQVEQVLFNLAANARDAMPQGGTLTLETEKSGAWAVITVTDTSRGMSAEELAHLFEPFFRASGRGPGTGLALASVYGTVQQSGGHIEVDSRPGHGSRFKVFLPAAAAPLPVEAPAVSSFPGGTETILLVEDEAGIRRLVVQFLERAGYHMLTAADGNEALELAVAHDGPIDLLITDVVLPGKSGRQVAEALRALRPGLRVLFQSGYNDDAILQHGIAEGEQNFLAKPFTVSQLARKVRAVLDQGLQEGRTE